MIGRYNKLMDMWRDLEAGRVNREEGLNFNQEINISQSRQAGNTNEQLNFRAPGTGDQICGDVITKTSQDGHTIFVMFVRGESSAYYSSDRSWSKPGNYFCAKLVDNDETTPELKDLGIDSEEVYKIANCVRER